MLVYWPPIPAIKDKEQRQRRKQLGREQQRRAMRGKEVGEQERRIWGFSASGPVGAAMHV